MKIKKKIELLEGEIEKKIIQLKNGQKKAPSQLRLTCQTHDLDHEIKITS
jgi:hypothetical protein